MSWEQVLIALAAGVPALTVGILAYRASIKKDAVSAQSGIASFHQTGTAQVLEGLNRLVDQLQEDNMAFRDDIRDLAMRLKEVTVERDGLHMEVARLRKRYGDNGNTPSPPTKEN